MNVSRRTALGLAVTGIGLAACGKSSDNTPSSSTVAADEAYDIAKDAYVFGYPLVLMDLTRAAAEAVTPVNTFQHAGAPPTPERRDVVRLNLDTLYSAAWLDVSAEPVVLRVPAMDPGRFWLMQLLDAWTNTVHNPSSVRPQVNSGGPPYTYLVTGPKWPGTVPDDMTQLSVPTPTVWLLGRIQVNGPDDIPVVTALQEQLKLAPLSAGRRVGRHRRPRHRRARPRCRRRSRCSRWMRRPSMAMRLYAPKDIAVDGLWQPTVLTVVR